ncbi:urease subunit gamma [Yinghuangia soli]|uniref:urease n=1 Tax=Yinghuangia soli TaxID=2908204 RepID=A0AA41PXU4_9ACTN|nr:urease subunit gamma [Yinghuangia soli]MCF2527873.1 urease subunit gamma [Yinghuangia soli]
MRLTPTERDRLLIFTAAELARARRARGLRLNVPEAHALIADTVCEAARDGRRLAEAIDLARSVLGPGDVLPGVVDIVGTVKVEAVFDDATRLAVVSDPFRSAERVGAAPTGNDRTCHAGGSRTGAAETTPLDAAAPGALGPDAPGAVLFGDAPTDPFADADVVTLDVQNTSAVPVSVTSHFHFFEANPRLRFDRSAAYGRRAAIPAGSTVRFDPGATVSVGLVPIGGARIAIGFAGLVDGPLDAPGAKDEALRRAHACGYLDTGNPDQQPVEPRIYAHGGPGRGDAEDGRQGAGQGAGQGGGQGGSQGAGRGSGQGDRQNDSQNDREGGGR